MRNDYGIPSSWINVEIEEILEPRFNGKTVQQGWSPRCERFPSEESESWGVLKTTAIQEGKFLSQENKQLPENLEPKTQIEIQAGDIVMTCAGPRQRCGVACLITDTRPKLMMSGKMYRFRPVEGHFNSKYLELVLLSQGAKKAIDKMKTGISDSGLNLTHDRFRQLNIPVAPQKEQDRIVAKIEELFSKLDKGIESLKKAREQLRVYRQALLKHAFEGKLTEQWCKDNADKLETADQLLERIKKEREAHYQRQLEEWKAAVKRWEADGKKRRKPSRPSKPKLYGPISDQELVGLEALPNKWMYIKFGELIESSQNGLSKRIGKNGSEAVVLRLADINNEEVDHSDARSILLTKDEQRKYLLKMDDLLCIRVNGSPELVGRVILIREDATLAYCDHFIRYRPLLSLSDPGYLKYYFNTRYVRRYVDLNKVSSAGQNTVNQDTMGNILVAFCGIHEQQQIISILEEKFSVLNVLDNSVNENLEKLEALRQSILKKAFSGQLVAQNPNDEPASALLARIAEEKEALERAKKPKVVRKKGRPRKIKATVLPFKTRIEGISTTDLHAGILALAYRHYEGSEKSAQYFGHVKGEKIAHLVEAHLGIDLDRHPVKDAAGPNDYPHLKKVESRARKAGFFNVKREGLRYVITPFRQFDVIVDKTKNALGIRLVDVESLIELMKPLDTRQAEIVATLFAAWNNLLLEGVQSDDDSIVSEARENWHPQKLEIERNKFFQGLIWMRKNGLIPMGQGDKVVARKRARKS